ncbi:MAG: metallophosphoesterase [Acidobacteriia bacterium]|nr:metallophosphoesterase [Terriglobia bacterium]
MPLTRCLFATDLHGHADRYEKLFAAVERERPSALLLGGDLLPHPFAQGGPADFFAEVLGPGLTDLRRGLGDGYPRVLAILGNDDPRSAARALEDLAGDGLLEHVHMRCVSLGAFAVLGYACVPPTPFLLKDWERWDVSRHIEPGCVSPEEGYRSVPADPSDVRYGTIARDLAGLAGEEDVGRSVLLFHAPPYRTDLDRADLDGHTFEHVPLDVHVGSIAIRRFIEEHQPLVTLHGHVHESPRLTGSWREMIGRTWCLSAAHDGPELALVRLDLEEPSTATRELI